MGNGQLINSFILGIGQSNLYATTIGMGAWLGTIMLFNVWVLIWPNQKKILGIVQASDEEKNKARRVAFLASRSNTLMSIPMLLFMGSASHGLMF
ncbi:MAG: urate hydroxylase PuuD, partial [Gammaproteobacteria bacterium]|nr:urate hydroxylase PuuD [Gammaproteobacteria bacterium]